MAGVVLAAMVLSLGVCIQKAGAVTAFDVTVANVGWWYNHNHGLEFTTTTPITVTSLGTFDYQGNGLRSAVPMAIYDFNTHAMLAGSYTVVPAGTGGELLGIFRYQALSSPLELPANGRYLLVANVGDYLLYPPANFVQNSPSVVINRYMNYISWGMTSSIAWPARACYEEPLSAPDVYQHALSLNFQFNEPPAPAPANSPVPEPASVVMMLSGLAGIGGWSLKRKAAR